MRTTRFEITQDMRRIAGRDAYMPIPAPRIPNLISMVYATNATSTSMPLVHFVMEALDMSLFDFLLRDGIPASTIVDVLIQLCVLLDKLQTEFEFMHRDLRGSNVMLKWLLGVRTPRVMPIDFGISRMVVTQPDGRRIEIGFPSSGGVPERRWRGQLDPYDDSHMWFDNNRFESSLDLSILLLSLRRTVLFKLVDPCASARPDPKSPVRQLRPTLVEQDLSQCAVANSQAANIRRTESTARPSPRPRATGSRRARRTRTTDPEGRTRYTKTRSARNTRY